MANIRVKCWEEFREVCAFFSAHPTIKSHVGTRMTIDVNTFLEYWNSTYVHTLEEVDYYRYFTSTHTSHSRSELIRCLNSLNIAFTRKRSTSREQNWLFGMDQSIHREEVLWDGLCKFYTKLSFSKLSHFITFHHFLFPVDTSFS